MQQLEKASDRVPVLELIDFKFYRLIYISMYYVYLGKESIDSLRHFFWNGNEFKEVLVHVYARGLVYYHILYLTRSSHFGALDDF